MKNCIVAVVLLSLMAIVHAAPASAVSYSFYNNSGYDLTFEAELIGFSSPTAYITSIRANGNLTDSLFGKGFRDITVSFNLMSPPSSKRCSISPVNSSFDAAFTITFDGATVTVTCPGEPTLTCTPH